MCSWTASDAGQVCKSCAKPFGHLGAQTKRKTHNWRQLMTLLLEICRTHLPVYYCEIQAHAGGRKQTRTAESSWDYHKEFWGILGVQLPKVNCGKWSISSLLAQRANSDQVATLDLRRIMMISRAHNYHWEFMAIKHRKCWPEWGVAYCIAGTLLQLVAAECHRAVDRQKPGQKLSNPFSIVIRT